MKRLGLLSILSLILLASCSFFIDTFEDEEYQVIGLKKNNISLVFSHNINGETHPCGCRHFPLGGLPQVAGLFHKLKKDADLVYIDTGDTFFPSANLPKSIHNSQGYTAKSLAKGLSDLNLLFTVPGDQDMALGFPFYKDLIEKNSFQALVANLPENSDLPHKKWIQLKKGPHHIFITAVTSPSVYLRSIGSKFDSPTKSLEAVFKTIEKNGYKKSNPFHRLIVLSHSGMDADIKTAKRFPFIDWIVGAHSQDFTKFPEEQGSTKIVQVLSRNHYLGEIKISLSGSKTKDSFQIHEVRDELKDELKPNPFLSYIDNHKAELEKIQQDEQNKIAGQFSEVNDPIKTANSCLECHESQGQKWMSTAHSLAMVTLVNAKEKNNLTCIKCHSVALNKPKGFNTFSNSIKFDPSIKDVKKHREKYWKEFEKTFSPIKSVRTLSSSKTSIYARKLQNLDARLKVTHNYTGVQCLNCHDKGNEHPFDGIRNELTVDQKFEKMKGKCISCHDSEQSPSWYDKDSKGFPTKLNELKLVKKIESIACPQGE